MMYESPTPLAGAARLEDYLAAVRRHKVLVATITLGGLLLAMLYVRSQTDEYTATAVVALGPTPVGATSANVLVLPNLDKERRLVESVQVATLVAEGLPDAPSTPASLLPSLATSFTPDSDVIEIEYTDVDPARAQGLANAFATEYVELREGAALAFYTDNRLVLAGQAQTLEDTVAESQDQLNELYADRGQAYITYAGEPSQLNAELNQLDAQITEVSTTRALASNELSTVKTRLRQIDSDLATRAPAASVIREAELPGVPNGISDRVWQVLGLILGLIAGVFTAFLVERLSTRARDEADVAAALGVPVIGTVPEMGLLRRLRPGAPIMLTGGRGPRGHAVTEAFRRLRSALQFIGNSDDDRVFIVTSADAKEGKSTVSSNLAVALAKAGSSVALVSADMRRPSIEDRFVVQPTGPGLADHLMGAGTVSPTALEEMPGLWIVHAGSLPPNPGELLASEAFGDLVRRIRREIDYVIIDTPPILAAADALAAASHGAAVIVVADVKTTETDELARARAELERAGAKVRGAVANRLPQRRSGWFGRRNYGYYQPTKARAKAKVA